MDVNMGVCVGMGVDNMAYEILLLQTTDCPYNIKSPAGYRFWVLCGCLVPKIGECWLTR